MVDYSEEIQTGVLPLLVMNKKIHGVSNVDEQKKSEKGSLLDGVNQLDLIVSNDSNEVQYILLIPLFYSPENEGGANI